MVRVEPDGVDPFWAVTRHADVLAVSRDHERFGSAGRWLILPRGVDLVGTSSGSAPLRMLVNMDGPEHRSYRRVASPWFTPSSIKRLEPRIERAADRLVASLCGSGDPIDIVEDLASRLPLFVITEMLGVPEPDAELVLHLSNENFGAADPDFRRSTGDRAGFLRELGDYLVELGKTRRAEPRGDLATIIATAEIDGQPMPELELMSYLYLLATAGHETTRNAISGGLLALTERPAEYERLCQEPALLESATEEVLRWTSPIIHFARTARRPCSLAGQQIAAGDSVVVFYPSANRDEAVFDRSSDFRIDRSPNPHLAFGFGEHFCLGAALARIEIRAVLRALAARVTRVEQLGDVQRLRSSFVGGLKRFPAILRAEERSGWSR